MTTLTYILAAILILWSLIEGKTNLRPLPAYVLGILHQPFNIILWRGLLLGPVVMLASIYTGVRAFFDPSAFWLKATIVFILVNIVAVILVWYFTYRMTKPAYEQFKREQNR